MITEAQLLRSSQNIKAALSIPEEVDDLLVGLAFLAPEFSKEFTGKRRTMVRNRDKLASALSAKLRTLYGADDYEILEFLGDAVIHLVVREYLVFRFGHEGPGKLTQIAHPIESNRFLQCLMNNRGLCSMLFGVNLTRAMAGGHPLCADSFEALTGAIYYYYANVRADKSQAIHQVERWLFDVWQVGKYIDEVRTTSTFTCGVSPAPVEIEPCEAVTAAEKLGCLSKTLDLRWSNVDDVVSIVLVTERTQVVLAVIRGPDTDIAYSMAAEIALAKLEEMGLVQM